MKFMPSVAGSGGYVEGSVLGTLAWSVPRVFSRSRHAGSLKLLREPQRALGTLDHRRVTAPPLPRRRSLAVFRD